MASGAIKVQQREEYEYFSFALKTETITGGNYQEWAGNSAVNCHKDGYEPLAVIRVTTNKSNVVLCGFTLSISSETVTVLAKNISQNAVTVDSGGVYVLYRKL